MSTIKRIVSLIEKSTQKDKPRHKLIYTMIVFGIAANLAYGIGASVWSEDDGTLVNLLTILFNPAGWGAGVIGGFLIIKLWEKEEE